MTKRSKIVIPLVIIGLISTIVTFSLVYVLNTAGPPIIEIEKEAANSMQPSQDPVVNIYKSIKRDWTFDPEEADKLSALLERECNTTELFLTTQTNVHLNDTLKFEAERKSRLNVTSDVFERFPKKMPFASKSFKKCSLVGSSGILLGSKCGQSIDAADFVMRFNLASVRNYSEDVGSKTDLITCNPTILERKYASLDKNGTLDFKDYMQREYSDSLVYMPAFTYFSCKNLSFAVQDALEPLNFKVVYPHPSHITLVKKFWKARNIKERRTTTGFLLFSGAMSFCEEVHLYGYWPFPNDPDGNPLYYHYFDKDAVMLPPEKLKKLHHNMHTEFTMLRDLHNKGAIHMHVGKCSSS
ncbi:alpha-2,8-sialyltransferase 8E-like [Ptychodera flava]|uniref:alpha-2,8-sialyltransferase 8E-like n=1 Tax=Ptychodera flava TaxID=63121 RepID=UPI00396AB011